MRHRRRRRSLRDTSGAWCRDGNHVLALSEHPSERQLPGRDAFRIGDLAHTGHELEVLGEALPLKTWMVPAEVTLGKSSGELKLPDKKPRPSGEYATNPPPVRFRYCHFD
jgi:hypothetical protein